MKKILSILIVCQLCVLAMAADEVEFVASAPPQVIMGKPFQLTYVVNQVVRDFRAPEFTDFEFLVGPYIAKSSSTSFENGKRTSSFRLTYTYTLKAKKEGTYTISPASVKIDGKQYTSNGVRITVLPPDAPNTGQSQAKNESVSGEQRDSERVNEENIFMRTLVSKTKVCEQEAILLTYKLYFAGIDVAQVTNNIRIPEFGGFLKQDLEQSEIQTELEHYDGRNYQTAVLYRTVLFAQRAGDIKIDPAQFEVVLRVQNRARVRSFFDINNTYTMVAKPLEAPGITIHVDALPSGKPMSYSGGVGQFTMDSKISSTDVQANEAITLTITIKGTGNLKLVKTPSVDWPDAFEVYDAKVTNDFTNTTAGTTGTKVIEYLAIPRAGGQYTIPAVEMAYYDINDKAYHTLRTKEYMVNIARTQGGQESNGVVNSYVNKEDIQQLATDIRYIHTDANVLTIPMHVLRFGSWSFWMCYFVPLLLVVIVFVVFRRRIKENADITRVRYKKANKVAQRRLKVAEKLLRANQKEAFYEEIERAAWTYLSDRLSVPTSQLNKENISQILRAKSVSEALIEMTMHVLSEAEFARYTPQVDGAMQDMFATTSKLINSLEEQKL